MTPHQKNSDEVCETPAAESNVQLEPHTATLGEALAPVLENLHGAEQVLQAAQHQRQHPSGGTVVIAALAAQQPARWQGIPQELRERAQWCVAGVDKAPRIATQGLPLAKSNDPSTWRTFDEASAFAAHHGLHVGYFLSESDPYTCIDLDVKDSTTQEELDRYWRLIEHFNSYTEYSRSGKGFHIWVKGKVGLGARKLGVEVYSQARYIICTGNPLPGYDKPIEPRQHELDRLLETIREGAAAQQETELVEVETDISDDELWSRASTATNKDKFLSLFNVGDWAGWGYPSQSEADLSLMSMLCFYSKSNDQCRRVFRHSALGKRPKAIKDNVYLNRTLRMVRARQTADEPNARHGEQVALQLMAAEGLKRIAAKHPTRITTAGGLRLVAANEIAARPPMKWLVRGVLPEKGIGAIYGQPGSGKSFLVLDLLAAVAGGFHWFGIPTKAAPVVYITLEGQAGMPQRIHAYRTKKGSLDHIAFIEQSIDLREPDTLKELIDLIRDAGLGGGVVCIDTLAASAPGMDENTSADMGQLIANLQVLQTELGGMVLVVHHSGKDEAKGLRGWSGLNGALDCSIAVSRVSEAKQNTSRRWEVSKSKDGSDGMKAEFALEQVQLGFDEDGQPITSCAISRSVQERVTATERHAAEEEFIWQWIRASMDNGKRPSRRALEGERDQMQARMKLTQKQLRDAISRLVNNQRVYDEKESGNTWLRAIDGGIDA